MNSIITAQNLSFELPNGRELFKNLNITINSKLTALVGPNGVGKTCLARLLANELEPTTGSIRRTNTVTLFSQRQDPEMITVDEFLAQDYTWSPLGDKLLQNIDRQAFCTTLSGGEWMRVRLTRTLGDQFLILDEPTNDLDRDGRAALIQFLTENQAGALLISHDRECLSLCDDILELSNKGLSKFGKGWHAYLEEKQQEQSSQQTALEVAKRERDQSHLERQCQIQRQEKRNQRGKAAAIKGGMPKILIGARKRRAQATTGRIDNATYETATAAVRDAHEALTDLKIDPVMYADLIGYEIPNQKLIVEAKNFNIKFQDWLYKEDLNFTWRGNIRIAIKGANGSGKSTLLKAILGETFETRGELRRGKVNTLVIDQRCAVLNDNESILENIRSVSTATESEIRTALARFLFTKDSVFQKVGELSGGERLRAALARGFLGSARPELLVLDEPTNNLDLANIEFLEGLVRGFRGALLVVSHDEVFLGNCGVESEVGV